MDPLEQDFNPDDFAYTSNPVLLWWAEAVALLARLPPHQRIQILTRIAQDIRDTRDTPLDEQFVGCLHITRERGIDVRVFRDSEGPIMAEIEALRSLERMWLYLENEDG